MGLRRTAEGKRHIKFNNFKIGETNMKNLTKNDIYEIIAHLSLVVVLVGALAIS